MIEYTIDEHQRLIQVRMSGSNSCADLEKHIAAVYRDPRYKSSLQTLFQIDENAGGPILSELPDATRVLELAAQTPDALRKWAVVIPSEFKRMMAEYLLKDLELQPLEMRVFANEPAALAWLNEP